MATSWNGARLCLLGLLVGVLSACSPIDDGKVGITRDEWGQLVGLALACEGRFDGAGLYQDDDPAARTLTVLGRWSRPDASKGLLTWHLESAEPSTWETSQPLGKDALAEGHTYVLDAVGELQKWSAEDLRFTEADLDTVTADTVLTTRADPKTGEVRPALVQRSGFEASACGPGAQ